jgi:hypothetical protein
VILRTRRNEVRHLTAVLLLALCVAGRVSAIPDSTGEMKLDFSFLTFADSAYGGPQYFSLRIWWKVGVLLGEPVVYAEAAALVPADARIALNDLPGQLELGQSAVVSPPREVLARIRVIDLLVRGHARGKGTITFSPYCLALDPGAMSKPFIGDDLGYGGFSSLTREERKQYISFNVPGSPSWGEMFEDEKSLKDRNRRDRFAPPGFAKECVLKGFDLLRPEVVRCRFDLTPVMDWLRQEQQARIAQERSRIAAARKVIEEKKARSEKAAADDFWNTPENWETRADRDERISYEQSVQKVVQSEARTAKAAEVIAAASQSVEKEVRRPASLEESAIRSIDLLRRRAMDKISDYQRQKCGSYPEPRLMLTASRVGENLTAEERERREQAAREAARERERELARQQAEWKECAQRTEQDPEMIALRAELKDIEAQFLRFKATEASR